MGLSSVDLSSYEKKAGSFNENYTPDYLKNNNNSVNGLSVETIDFSFNSNNLNNVGNDSLSSGSTPSLVNSENIKTYKYDEADDFSGGDYSEYTLQQYFLKYGDINGDGKINNDDTILMQKYLSSDVSDNDVLTQVLNKRDLFLSFPLHLDINTRVKNGVGDIDGDGKVTLKDVTLMQKYISDGKFEPTNITMANRLDTLKYTHVQTQNNDDLTKKKSDLDFINTLIGQQKVVNSIKVVPDSSINKLNAKSNSNPFDVNSGSEEDYLFYNTIHDNNLSLTLPNGHDQTSNDALKQYLAKRLVNSTLYRKNHNTMMLNPNKGVEDAACDYIIKHAAEIVDYEMAYGSLQDAQAAYKSNIAALTYSKKQINKQIAIIPYDNIMKTGDFKKFANNINVESLDPKNNDKLKNCSKYMDSYKYLSVEQLTMFNYLLDTKGEDAANKYLEAYEEDINQAKGLEQANKFIDKLDKNFDKIVKDDGNLMDENDISKLQGLLNNNQYDAKYDMNDDGKLTNEDLTKLTQYIDAGGEILTTLGNLKISFDGGFLDGINTFFTGFKYIGDDTAIMSADEYKMMFIAQKLQQNGLVSNTYEFGQTVGNMTPTIVASAAATLATAYFGGEGGVAVLGSSLSAQQVGQITAATLIFGSTYGKSKHDALVKGHDLETSIGYGFLSGLSESSLETLLGSLPFVSKGCSNVFTAMFKEGLSESAQTFVSTMIGQCMLDEEIDISGLSAELGKSFIYGALLSGASNGLSTGVKVVINGVKYKLSSQQIMDYYKASIDPKTGENNGLSLQEYVVKNVNPNADQTTQKTEGYTDHINMDDYKNTRCDYSLDSILKGSFKQKCDAIFDSVTDETKRQTLEDILFRGQVGDYSFASDIQHKDNPSFEGKRRIGMANLYLSNPETFKVLCDKKVNLFHGTNGVALADIAENGLKSFHDLNQSGYNVNTGEKWSRIEGHDRGFVSFADILDLSTRYSTLSVKDSLSGSFFDFPVLIGTTTDAARAGGITTVFSDVSEVGVKGLSVDGIKVVCVPPDKVFIAQQLFDGTDVSVMPLDFETINNNSLYQSIF